MKMFHQSAQLPAKGEAGVWYHDPRLWVLIFAFLMFFGTMISETSHSQLLVP